ncbi:MAG TPA: hypothetical protein VNS11_07165 [Sphingomicrobium sp.]|nr:hypothetical protein [Sphingomicrobium sp.]
MRGTKVRIASGAVVAALLFSSTASGAASVAAPATAQPAQDSWLTLSMLTPAGTLGLAGAAAVQPGPPTDNPPPPPPPPAYGSIQSPPIPVIVVWLATLATAVYILTRHRHGRFFFPVPNSPG